MNRLLVALLLICVVGCSQKERLLGDTDWQKQTNATFKDASKSPLKKKDLKAFKTLDFFPFDSSYVVKAQLIKTPNSEWFNMKTTSGEVSEERIYGLLKFSLNGQDFQLNVYQGKENLESEEYVDYLFLPFLDDSNGETTYEGGRYIDLRIPEGNTITINFNRAYNPYCAYNEKYSCPIVPRINYLPTKVEAGIKSFKKE